MAQVNGFRDLIVYRKGYGLAMEIFDNTRPFPKEEKYARTDQIRCSSGSVTSNIAESWAEEIYIKAFVNKLSDSPGEEYDTERWLDYSKDCGYINHEKHAALLSRGDDVRKMLISMINHPEKF